MMKIIQSVLLSFLLAISASVFAVQVNINQADSTAISRALVGIGDKKAEAIIAYRKANCPFKSVDELAKVKGIGESILMKNVGNIVTE